MIFWAKSSFSSADHDLIASIDLPIATFAPNPNANVRRTIRAAHQIIRKSVDSVSICRPWCLEKSLTRRENNKESRI
jgi:hypothetical protein